MMVNRVIQAGEDSQGDLSDAADAFANTVLAAGEISKGQKKK